MSNHQVENWAQHIEQLKEWDKSIAEYAKVYNLNKAKLYYWRRLLSKTQKIEASPSA